MKQKGIKKIEGHVDKVFFLGEYFEENATEFEFAPGEKKQISTIASYLKSKSDNFDNEDEPHKKKKKRQQVKDRL